MNGADITEPYNLNNKSGASNNTLGANDIAEAAVILNAFSAQYGRMAGGQVNFITKSGGNSFHGNLSEDFNGAILNANDFFNSATGTPRGRSVANQYAAGLGGPIRKNKTVFYVNTEGLRYALPSNGVVSVPSPQFEQYALTHVPVASVRFIRPRSISITARPASTAPCPSPPGPDSSRTAPAISVASARSSPAPMSMAPAGPSSAATSLCSRLRHQHLQHQYRKLPLCPHRSQSHG